MKRLYAYQTTRGGSAFGPSYRYWVLVEVPSSEYERVQEWKREREEAERTRRDQDDAQRRKLLAEFLARHAEQLQKADTAFREGALSRTLSLLDAERARLEQAAARHQQPIGLPEDASKDRTFGLEMTKALGEIDERVAGIQASLSFDSGRFGEVRLAPGSRGGEVPVWVCLQEADGCRPIAHFPVLLRDTEGHALSHGQSDRGGRAELHVGSLASGSYRVAIDTAVGALSTLRDETREPLQKIEAPIAIWRASGNLQDAVAAAAANLMNGPSFAPLPARSVVLGPATYGQSGRGSAFALILKPYLERELAAIDGLELRTPQPRSAQSITRALHTRGIGARSRPLGAAATQAVIDAADAAIETTYSLLGDELQIDLRLKRAGSDELLSATTASVAASRLPPGVAIRPARDREPMAPFPASSKAIHLEVTSHLGDGQTYREGESISFFVSADRDAYLLLVYEDAARRLIQILPNLYSKTARYPAGRFIEVPGPADRFDFVVAGPAFGLERIWGFAASQPFRSLTGSATTDGLLALQTDLPSLLSELRAEGHARGVAYGEAQAVVTTVPK